MYVFFYVFCLFVCFFLSFFVCLCVLFFCLFVVSRVTRSLSFPDLLLSENRQMEPAPGLFAVPLREERFCGRKLETSTGLNHDVRFSAGEADSEEGAEPGEVGQ